MNRAIRRLLRALRRRTQPLPAPEHLHSDLQSLWAELATALDVREPDRAIELELLVVLIGNLRERDEANVEVVALAASLTRSLRH